MTSVMRSPSDKPACVSDLEADIIRISQDNSMSFEHAVAMHRVIPPSAYIFDEAALAGIPRQAAASMSCETRGRINAERLSRETNDELEALADKGGD